MKPTKHRGVYFRVLKDGSQSYYIRPSIGGKRTWIKAGETLTEAKDLIATYRATQPLKIFGFKLPRRITFRKLAGLYAEDYCRRKGVEWKKAYRVRGIVKHLVELFGNIPVMEIDKLTIDRADLSREHKQYLRTILNAGKEWKFLHEGPRIKVEKSRSRERVLTHDELQIIMQQAGPDHRDAILLSLSLGGMRLGELCKITTENTDFDKMTVRIEDRKAGVGKTFYISPTACRIIRRRLLAGGGRLFRHSPNYLSQKFATERKRMKGIKEDWRFHDLRGSLWNILRGEIDIDVARALMGHTDVKTTLRHYARSTEAAERAALETVDGFINGLQKDYGQ